MSSAPRLSVIVLSWNTKDLLRACLAALGRGLDEISSEVIVVDNHSDDGSPEMVEAEFPEVRLRRNPENRGYAIGVNDGIEWARGWAVCLLGSDTEVDPGTMPALLKDLEQHPTWAAVAPPLEGFDGGRQQACMRFPRLRTALFWDTPLQHFLPDAKELRRYQMKDWDHRGSRPVDQPPGTCLMLKRAVFQEIGVMDPKLWLFFNDVDLCKRIWEGGYEIHYREVPPVKHHEGGSTRHYASFAIEWHKNRIRYYRKHFGFRGAWLTKTVMLYAAVRQCCRMLKDLPLGKEWWGQSRQILRMSWQLLNT